MARAIILVLDSFGIGATEDADKFGDAGSNTLLHIAQACARGECDADRHGPLYVPNLTELGLGKACEESCGEVPPGLEMASLATGAYGYAKELSSGKDTPSGHWEMAGVPVLFDWGYFTDKHNSFPAELVERMVTAANLPGILGNCHAPGTDIINRFGQEHLQSGKPICYTSADSVFQIACHEDVFSNEQLYDLCLKARKIVDDYNIGRVIARPFNGNSKDGFERTAHRRDYAIPPPAPTVLDKLCDAGGEVISIGKISDIFAGQGISRGIKAHGLSELIGRTCETLDSQPDNSIIFTNLVDFDTLYGHRRDIAGYARELEAFDKLLPYVMASMQAEDLLILTADHGCDPTHPGTDHTREHVPVLAYGYGVSAGSLGGRETFADIGQSLTTLFNLPPMDYGSSFISLPGV